MRRLLACLASAFMGAGFTLWLCDLHRPQSEAQESRPARGPQLSPQEERGRPRPQDSELPFDADLLTPEERANIFVYEHCNKGVVNITTKMTRVEAFVVEVAAEGSGSGSVIDRKGHVLTNYHVVEDASQIGCTLFDGKTYEATVVGTDPINDIAVLKIDAPEDVLFPISFGDSSVLKVGMKVYAIGNPFGLERTMTTGIISSLNRTLQVYKDRSIKSIIQIDAAVNPGNSGGPLLNSRGQLIGVNTAIASRTGQNSGVGFAIPANLVKRVVPELLLHGRFLRPESGILRVFETEDGLLVAQTAPNGPAEQAGLRGPRIQRQRRGPFSVDRIDRSAADLIIEVDGEKVKTAGDFLGYLDTRKPGDVVELTIVREGRTIKVPLKLGRSEPPPARATSPR